MTLQVDDLAVCVGARRLVGPVGFSAGPGEPLTILGETGAGKSLLAQAVMGALPKELRANLISIGIWILRETDKIRKGESDNIAGILEISKIIRGGLG